MISKEQETLYAERLKKHLSDYREDPDWGLGIVGRGECQHKAYSHILPADLYKQNVLETISDEFWGYWKNLPITNGEGPRGRRKRNAPRLHKCFPHLNSSQALAFNLFFPFLQDGLAHIKILFKALNLEFEPAENILFEDVPDPKEGSNFDVTIVCKSGRRVLIEVKLTETKFGDCQDDAKHQKKLVDYKLSLHDIVGETWLEPLKFFQHYQIMRHYARMKGDQTDVVFLFPKENESLKEGEAAIKASLLPAYVPRMKVAHLTEFVTEIIEQSGRNSDLTAHFQLVAKKYLLSNPQVTNSVGEARPTSN